MNKAGQLVDQKSIEIFEQFYETSDHKCPNENIVRLANGFLKPKKDKKLLDYGFGPGENLLHFLRSGFKCSGVEVSENAKKLVEQKLTKYPEFSDRIELKLIGGGDLKLPWDDNTFDYIVSNQVLYYLVAKEKITCVLNEFKRILKPGGKIIVSMIGQHDTYCVDAEEIAPDVYKYVYEESQLNEFVDVENNNERYIYGIRDEDHMWEMFSMFNITEIGWWREQYMGVSNHHYVALASKED